MIAKKCILVVDDSDVTRELLRRNLENAGYSVIDVADVESAVLILREKQIDLVITDMRMPHVSGFDLLHHLSDHYSSIPSIMITGYATVQNAVKAVKEGASEYLAKPFTEDELFTAVNQALEAGRLAQAAEEIVAEEPIHESWGMIGDSEPMQQVYKTLKKAADSTATVLVEGESGTGKELVARAIHYSSKRASAPFVPVNLAGVPETLIESALFGHVKGAFTGASSNRKGYFQAADGGTLFLDEVSEIPVHIQTKLLRALQEREVVMVGETMSRPVDVRVVAATNRDLREMIAKGTFREDLYFRLNVVPISLPPLREREEDVLTLIQVFASQFATEMGRKVPVFSKKALTHLQEYPWPGNVRELENVIQHLLVMSDHEAIRVADLPELMKHSVPSKGGLNRSLAEVEMTHIERVLASVGKNKSKAAKILGIDRKTLRMKLEKAKNRIETGRN